MSDPFEPPDVAPGRTQPPLGVIAGTGLGNTLHMTGVLRDATAAMGLGGAALLVGLCLVLLGVERRHARARRPLHPSARGEVPPPIHGLLFAPPLALLIPSLLWLGVVGSVTLGNLAPAVVFGAGAIGAAWAGVKVGSAHRLTMAIEDLYRGVVERARGLLLALAGHPLAT